MGGEPWLLTPSEIGKLTDWQIWELYVRPAVERQERDSGPPQKPRRKGAHDDGLPSRAEFIECGLLMKIPQEKLEADYDAWAASEEGQAVFAKRKARKRKNGRNFR